MGLILAGIHWLLLAFLALLTIRAVLALVPLFARDWEPKGGLRVLAELVLTLTDPPIRFLGRFLPPVRLGGVELDLAFTVVYFAVLVLLRWI
jgi:YggT family protein